MRGAIMIVYPMGLPPYDPIKMEIDGNEDLSGTQVFIVCLIFSFFFFEFCCYLFTLKYPLMKVSSDEVSFDESILL